MESFVLAVNVVTPLLVYMFIGVLIRKFSILTEQNCKALNSMIFRILIPLTLFFSIYESDVRSAVRPKVYLYVLLCVLASFGIVWVILKRRLSDDLPTAVTLTQAIARSNFALFGVTIGTSLCDSEGMGTIAALMAVVTPTYNILSVLLFSALQKNAVSKGQIVKDVLKNPLVVAGILGLIVGLSGIVIPPIIAKPLSTLGSTATPMALMALGGMLTISSISDHRRYILFASFMRLIGMPLIILTVAVLIGMRGVELIAIFAVFAAPTAVASTPMAQEMGGDGKLAGEIVATTSFLSILTIFLWILVLSNMGLI